MPRYFRKGRGLLIIAGIVNTLGRNGVDGRFDERERQAA